jgi:transcriptional regulator with XRE-family HTH domain
MRSLRWQHRWRQADLGQRAGLSRDAVSRAERRQLDGITIGTLDRLATALDASLVIELRWQGAALERLEDRAHARLQNAAAARLGAAGWLTQAEVSFNHYGDRGSCDLVALHPATRTVLIVEVKSRIGNLQETLHRLDVKARVGRVVAAELRWPEPAHVARALVVPDDRTARRVIRQHPALFGAFSLQGRGALAWLQMPSGQPGLIWFERPADSDQRRTTSARRVRSERAAG